MRLDEALEEFTQLYRDNGGDEYAAAESLSPDARATLDRNKLSVEDCAALASTGREIDGGGSDADLLSVKTIPV